MVVSVWFTVNVTLLVTVKLRELTTVTVNA